MIEVFLYSLPDSSYLFPAPFNAVLLDSTTLQYIRLGMVVIGQMIFVLALSAFCDSWRVGVDGQAPGNLVTCGVFSISRNPIFIFLYFIGTFLINGTLIFLLFAVVIVAGAHYQILQDERFLRQNYGNEYRDYCARTKRYLGWVNRRTRALEYNQGQ